MPVAYAVLFFPLLVEKAWAVASLTVRPMRVVIPALERPGVANRQRSIRGVEQLVRGSSSTESRRQ